MTGSKSMGEEGLGSWPFHHNLQLIGILIPFYVIISNSSIIGVSVRIRNSRWIAQISTVVWVYFCSIMNIWGSRSIESLNFHLHSWFWNRFMNIFIFSIHRKKSKFFLLGAAIAKYFKLIMRNKKFDFSHKLEKIYLMLSKPYKGEIEPEMIHCREVWQWSLLMGCWMLNPDWVIDLFLYSWLTQSGSWEQLLIIFPYIANFWM